MEQRYNLEESQDLVIEKKKDQIKDLLKQKEKKKIVEYIDQLETGRSLIDEYVAKVTGIDIKSITSARNWHKILKKIIVEEGKDILNQALEEIIIEAEVEAAFDQDIIEYKRNEDLVMENSLFEKEENSITREENRISEKIEETDSDLEMGEELNDRSIVHLYQEEIAEISRKENLRNRTATDILLNVFAEPKIEIWQEDSKYEDAMEEVEQIVELQAVLSETKSEKESNIIIIDEILQEAEEVPLGTSQLEINSPKEYFRKQLEHAVLIHKEIRGSSMEESDWAPNKNICQDIGICTAKIAAYTVPGETKEERIKFVKGTLHKNEHIKGIEELFSKSNSWIVITFDCRKGKEEMKERILKKEVEWYKVIFEEDKQKTTVPKKEIEKGKKYEGIKNYEKANPIPKKELEEKSSKSGDEYSGNRLQKGKNKDFLWISLFDLPLNYSNQEIRRLLKHYGKVEEIKKFKREYYQVAEVKLFIYSEEQEMQIRRNWVIGLENGKLARVIVGTYDLEKLKEREKFRAILTNIPKTACETLLFRMLQRTRAKAVYIPFNSNRHPGHIAKVFYETKEDLEQALSKIIYYYNTKLFWKPKYNNYRGIEENKYEYTQEKSEAKKETISKPVQERTSRDSRKNNSSRSRLRDNTSNRIPQWEIKEKTRTQEIKERPGVQENKEIEERLRILQESFNNLNAELRSRNQETNSSSSSEKEAKQIPYRS
jgi:hypothetical protein